MTVITHIRHRADSAQREHQNAKQALQTKPGNYYVTVRDGKRYDFLAGPFKDNHQAALDLVECCREITETLDSWANFYAFGTARIDYGYDKPGKLNHLLGLGKGGAP